METPKIERNQELAFQLAQMISNAVYDLAEWDMTPQFSSRHSHERDFMGVDENRLRTMILEKLREFDAITG